VLDFASELAADCNAIRAFWNFGSKVLDGNETIEQDGKRVFRYTTADRIEVTTASAARPGNCST
jgi:hypothetical protein